MKAERAQCKAGCYRTLKIMGSVPIFSGAMLAEFAINTSYNTRRCNLQMKSAVGNSVSSSALQTSRSGSDLVHFHSCWRDSCVRGKHSL